MKDQNDMERGETQLIIWSWETSLVLKKKGGWFTLGIGEVLGPTDTITSDSRRSCQKINPDIHP